MFASIHGPARPGRGAQPLGVRVSEQDILLEAGTNELEIIEFFIDEKNADDPEGRPMRSHFGVNVAKVLEVVEAPDGMEPIASAVHPSFLGTIPLRDIILPVVDLAIWLGMDRAESEHESIIVTEFNNVITGFLVTGVTMIRRFSWGDVLPPSRFVSEMPTNCINGTVRIAERFTLLLDLERALSELNPDYGDVPEQDGEPAGREYTVLLVDDSTPVRALLRQVFERGGFQVEVRNNGAEAWEYLQEVQASVEGPVAASGLLDAVVSDVEMPQMDGYTLTRRIKEAPAFSGVPVVLFSSLVSKGLMHKGESVGADAQVTKPQFAALADIVGGLIDKARA